MQSNYLDNIIEKLHKYYYLERSAKMRLTKRLGFLLLGIWLILTGLIPLFHFNFSGLDIIMAILAIAAGVLILLER